jgi:hypothetical protein
MKKIIFAAVILFSCLSFKNANAQLRLSLGINIHSQPDWGPVGYNHVSYYYFPTHDIYYDVSEHQFIYFRNGGWHHVRHYVPGPGYGAFDPYHEYKVVINDSVNPWQEHDAVKAKYAAYKDRHDQVSIRDSHDPRYHDHWNGGY